MNEKWLGKNRIASLLAYDTMQHVIAEREQPRLHENSRAGISNNVGVALDVGIEALYNEAIRRYDNAPTWAYAPNHKDSGLKGQHMLTESEYNALTCRYNLYHTKRQEICATWNRVTEEEQKLLPEAPTCAEVSAIEVYEFCANPPDRYFAYVDLDRQVVTTWLGEPLGKIVHVGREYYSNMGDKRVAIQVRGINGLDYYGTYYTSAGDYCRLKRSVNSNPTTNP